MLEQQLVDYIKKAKEAGQSDDQTRSLLYKNGWTEAEVSEAFLTIGSSQPKTEAPAQLQAQPEPQAEYKPQPQTQVSGRPEINMEPQSGVQQRYQEPQPAEPKMAESPAVSTERQTISRPQYNPQPTVQEAMTRARRPHTFMKVLIVLIILVVLGGAGYIFAGQYISLPYVNIFWDLFKPNSNSQAVINNMLANMKNVKSSHITIQGDVTAANDSKAPLGKLSITAVSESDITDAANPKADGTFAFALTAGDETTSLGSANVSFSAVNDALYFDVNNATVPDTFSVTGLDMSQIIGKWFKIDKDSAAALSQTEDQQTGILDVSQINSSDFTGKIQNLILSENMFSVTKQLGDEVISGQDTYHYLVTIKKDKLNDLATKIISASMPANSQDNSGSLAQNMAQAFVKTFTDAMGDINVEMWIGKSDYLLYRYNIDKSINLSKVSPGANMQVEVKLNALISNFNKPITVHAPSTAQKLEDMLIPLLKTQKVKSDIGQIGSLAQSSFGANNTYSSFCSHGLLNGYLEDYGDTLVTLHGDVVGQGATKPACFSADQSFCVSTQIADGTYLCVDKNNVVGKTKCVSAQTVCK